MDILLKSLGCRLNEAELEHWAQEFVASGHSITTNHEKADLVVINTCAVTQEASRKSRKLIRQSQRTNPKAKLVVSGCYAHLSPNVTDEIAGIDMVIPNDEKDELVDIVQRELLPDAMPVLATESDGSALFARGRNRAFIKIQDGCRYRCAFCIVTVARGEERSRPMKDIIREINRVSEQGIHEVVLTGVHIDGYGSDIDNHLHGLIQKILDETNISRLRLGSLEPWDLSDTFFELFDNPRMMPHLHLPLQSGSDVVLRKMARRCKTSDFEKLITTARKEVADFNLTTDVIVGFPGESDYEWQQSMSYIERIGFSHVHIFPYSRRSCTRAADMPDQIDGTTIRDRCTQLHALATQMKQDYMAQFIGRTLPVLFDTESSLDPSS